MSIVQSDEFVAITLLCFFPSDEAAGGWTAQNLVQYAMSVQELEKAVTQLPSPELAKFTAWFAEYQGDLWDKQIEQDALSGRLDALAEQANQEFEAGRCRPL